MNSLHGTFGVTLKVCLLSKAREHAYTVLGGMDPFQVFQLDHTNLPASF